MSTNESLEEVAAVLEAKRAEIGRKCLEEINRVLDDHRCTLVPRVVITGGKIETSISVVPLPV